MRIIKYTLACVLVANSAFADLNTTKKKQLLNIKKQAKIMKECLNSYEIKKCKDLISKTDAERFSLMRKCVKNPKTPKCSKFKKIIS